MWLEVGSALATYWGKEGCKQEGKIFSSIKRKQAPLSGTLPCFREVPIQQQQAGDEQGNA